MSDFKPGDVIEDPYLGRGTILEKNKELGWWLVQWDKNPPVNYNMGQNPSFEQGHNFQRLTK